METTYWFYTYITRINGELSAGFGFDKSNYSHFDFYKFYKQYPKHIIIMTQQVSEEYAKKFYEYAKEEWYLTNYQTTIVPQITKKLTLFPKTFGISEGLAIFAALSLFYLRQTEAC